LREQSGVTQKLLGKRARLAAPRIHGIESGATTMSLLDALCLTAVLGVPLTTLLEPPTLAWADSRGPTPRDFTPPADALLGRMSDQEGALRIGCSPERVGERRRELGIPSVGKRR